MDMRRVGYVDVADDGRMTLALPGGERYAGRLLRRRAARGDFWVGRVHGLGAGAGAAEQSLLTSGGYPAQWPDGIDLTPFEVKIFLPSADTLVRGVVWLPSSTGRTHGEVHRLTFMRVGERLVGVSRLLRVYASVNADELVELLRTKSRQS